MLSRLLLLLVTLLSLIHLNIGQTTVATITLTQHSDLACSTTPPRKTLSYNADSCATDEEGHFKYFCDTTNTYVYRVEYSNSVCTYDSVVGVTQLPVGCGFARAGTQVSCSNPSSSPTVPTGAFPPNDYAVVSTFFTKTAVDATISTCIASESVGVYFSALRLGSCQERVSLSRDTTLSAFQSMYCTSDGAYYGQGTFYDTTCGSSMVSAVLVPTGVCRGAGSNTTTIVSCRTGSTVFPTTLPQQGYYVYENDETCTSKTPSIVLRQPSTCYDSVMTGCSTTGSTYTMSIYTPTGFQANGTCPASSTPLALQLSVGACAGGLLPTCSFTTSAAATNAIASIGATLFAAIIATIASRAL